MKIHYNKYFKFISTLVLTWFFLTFFKLFEFSFAIKPKHFFWFVLVFGTAFFYLETKKNFSVIHPQIKNIYFKFHAYYKAELLGVLNKDFFLKLSKYLGKRLTSVVARITTFFQIFWKFISKHLFNKKQLVYLFIIGFFLDVFVISLYFDLLTLFLTFLLVMVVKLYKINGKKVLTLALFLICFCVYFILIGEKMYAQKVSSWLFIFLILGMLKEILPFLNKDHTSSID